MQASPNITSAWQRLKRNELSCEEAIALLVDNEGIVNQTLLDKEVSSRFLRHFPDKSSLPPAIPLLLWRGCYYLGSPVPLSKETLAQLQQRTGSQIEVVPIADKSYRTWFHSQSLNPNRISSMPIVNPITGQLEQEDISETTEIYLSKAGDQIERIKTIISGALRNRASDIHLEPMVDGLRVRYRIDGVLRDITTLPITMSRRVVMALKVMCNMDIAEHRRPQDGRIEEKYASGDEAELNMDMRVSTLPCVNGEKAVIRLLPRENPFTHLGNLGFVPETMNAYKAWLEQPQGMIILTGPTGSGKTSTLYTSLQNVAKEHVNVVTVEDPVEYVLPGITQTQVHEAAGMTFAAGMRAILRQDPDIIMVGEVRDSETAETAVRAALTGHLVFTTLHTNDALGAIPRLKDLGIDPGLLSDALLGVVAQRLVRRVCPHCSEPYNPTESDLKVLGLGREQMRTDTWRKGRGCSMCFNSGFLGREAVVELIDVDDRIRDIIYEGTMTQLQRYLREINYASFRKAAVEKVMAGLTTVQEVLRVLPRCALYNNHFASDSVAESEYELNGRKLPELGRMQ
ncbi:GspE/PulE family protein [Scytonema millei]|uniref:Type II/IV secretion system protein n=1 Tax=Scytonema millei VB511283 TaxID=1245923 RepID=A0A9X5E4B5_9CYAN|nr:GspE/PulE family protein [Scytonema millei]NHC35006.1 type II/IV secretion system protein [Scytonema millei VB511283]